jgi:glutathione S-transferase
MHTKPRIVGRSSSSFTRITRIFACELGVDCELRVVRDLMSSNVEDYAGNPALKLPILQASTGTWFGTLNICRALALGSTRALHIVWPEDFREPLLANAQELTMHALATEVTLIMSKLGAGVEGAPHPAKVHASLLNVLEWLDVNAAGIFASLPAARQLSYLEVALFCLVTHLEFRAVVPVAQYRELAAFCRSFAERASARATAYCFDV